MTEMQRLTDRVVAASLALERAQAELAAHAGHATTEAKAKAECNPLVLADVETMVDQFLRDHPEGQWHTRGLAVLACWRCRQRQRHLTARQLETIYLPALRATSPHCVQDGRQWLWYLDAAKSRARQAAEIICAAIEADQASDAAKSKEA